MPGNGRRPAAPAGPQHGPGGAARYRRTFSPLTLRILAVNVLALAILVGGLLYLGRYQDRLIEASLKPSRRKPASSPEPSARPPSPVAATSNDLSHDLARQMVRRRSRRPIPGPGCSTLRHAGGRQPRADRTRRRGPDRGTAAAGPGRPLTRLAIDLYDEIVNALPSRDKFPVFREGPVQAADHYEDVVRALTGELSASVWTTPDHGMILTVAVPVQRFKQVLGAVMLSRAAPRSTPRSVRSGSTS